MELDQPNDRINVKATRDLEVKSYTSAGQVLCDLGDVDKTSCQISYEIIGKTVNETLVDAALNTDITWKSECWTLGAKYLIENRKEYWQW